MNFFTKAMIALSFCFATLAIAQTTDVSFGTGDLNGWVGGPSVGTQTGPYGSSGIGVATANGTQTISCCGTNTWTISPYTGSYMVGMQPGGSAHYSTMTTALGLSSSSITALNGQVASTGGSITSTAWISKDFTFSAVNDTDNYNLYVYWKDRKDFITSITSFARFANSCKKDANVFVSIKRLFTGSQN